MNNERKGSKQRNYLWSYSDRNTDDGRALPAEILESLQQQQIIRQYGSILSSAPTPQYLSNGIFSSIRGVDYNSLVEQNLNYWRQLLSARIGLSGVPVMDLPLLSTSLQHQGSLNHFWTTPSHYIFPEIDSQPSVSGTLAEYPATGVHPPPDYFTTERCEIESRIRALDDDIARTNLKLAQTKELLATNSPCNVTSLKSKGAIYYSGIQSMLNDKPPTNEDRLSFIDQLKRQATSTGVDGNSSRSRFRLQGTPRSQPSPGDNLASSDDLLTNKPQYSGVSVEMAHRFHNYARPAFHRRGGLMRGRSIISRNARRMKLSESSRFPNGSVPQNCVLKDDVVRRRPEKQNETIPETSSVSSLSTLANSYSKMSLSRGMQPFSFDNGIFITPQIFEAVMEIYKDFDLEEQGLPTFAECNYIVSFMHKHLLNAGASFQPL